MFALPGQSVDDVLADLAHAAELGADQLTTYPLFTFPYTQVGEYLHLTGVRMPDLRVRHEQYRAISDWCAAQRLRARLGVGLQARRRAALLVGHPRRLHRHRARVGLAPARRVRAQHLRPARPGRQALEAGRSPIALRMPFEGEMAGWWWLYWRFYDTRIPMGALDEALGDDADKARRWLSAVQRAGLAQRVNGSLELTDSGAFWLHLAQNHFALSYVNTLWTAARQTPWPEAVPI